MICRKLNERSYVCVFTDSELLFMRNVAESSGDSVEDCLTAFFSGCLCNFNNEFKRKRGKHELERQDEGMGRR